MKFRKKPVEVEALQLSKELFDKCPLYAGVTPFCFKQPGYWTVQTLEGTMRAEIGYWLITGVNGEEYAIKPDIFEKTYEPVT